jgi:hypothetical protein
MQREQTDRREETKKNKKKKAPWISGDQQEEEHPSLRCLPDLRDRNGTPQATTATPNAP